MNRQPYQLGSRFLWLLASIPCGLVLLSAYPETGWLGVALLLAWVFMPSGILDGED